MIAVIKTGQPSILKYVIELSHQGKYNGSIFCDEYRIYWSSDTTHPSPTHTIEAITMGLVHAIVNVTNYDIE